MKCPYCSAASAPHFTFYVRAYWQCPTCGLVFLGGKKREEEVLSYYRQGYYEEHVEDQTDRNQTGLYREILDRIEHETGQGDILDIGCGCGFFLCEAKERGWEVTGVDPSEQSILQAKKRIGDGAVCGTLDNLPADRVFDAVTFINALDHIVLPWQELKKAARLLKPGGLLYIRVPNGDFHCFMIRLFTAIHAESVIRPYLVFHEYALTRRFLARCLDDGGFTEIRIENARIAGDDIFRRSRKSARSLFLFATALARIVCGAARQFSRGRWLWQPSIEAFAKKNPGGPLS